MSGHRMAVCLLFLLLCNVYVFDSLSLGLSVCKSLLEASIIKLFSLILRIQCFGFLFSLVYACVIFVRFGYEKIDGGGELQHPLIDELLLINIFIPLFGFSYIFGDFLHHFAEGEQILDCLFVLLLLFSII